MLGITALVLFAEYKAGFTRAGVGVATYLATLLALWPVAVPKTRSWAVASVPVAGLLATFVAVLAMPISTLIDPVGRAVSLGAEADAVLFHRAETAAANAASLVAQFDLPPAALAQLSDRTVHIEPWEAAAADAYPGFRLGPGAGLSGLRRFHRRSGPHQRGAVGRAGRAGADPLADAAGSTAVDRWARGLVRCPEREDRMLCRYLPVATAADWQVLGRIPDGEDSVPVATVETRAGQPTSVPSNLPEGVGDDADLGVADDLASRLQILAYRGAPWSVSDADRRFGPIGTAAQPNVIGATGAIGYCGPLALAPAPTSHCRA